VGEVTDLCLDFVFLVGFKMHITSLLPFALLASAAPKPPPGPLPRPSPPPGPSPPSPLPSHLAPPPPLPKPISNIVCPIIFDGRITKNLTLSSFDSASTSPYSPSYVKGENTTWSSILLLPKAPVSRFDDARLHKPLEVTIDNRSLFRAGEKLQVGFRRAGLLLKDDANDPGADAADAGVVTFHWSIQQDAARPLNLTHEYMNVWHERADYNGNQFTFVGGVVLPGDGGKDTEGGKWRVQNAKNEFVFQVPIEKREWQNFGIQLNYANK
jgi:hypothetical protein